MNPLPTALPKARFAQKAESYDANARIQAEVAEWLAEWLPATPSKAKVLELGAGTGLYTRYLTKCFDNLTCTDLSNEMLEVSRHRAPGPSAYHLQNAWEPLPDPGHWDLLTSSSLLQWTPDPVSTLNHWSKALTPKGRILAAFFIAPTLSEMETVTRHPGPVQWRDANTWQTIFQSVGLQTLRIEEQTQRYVFPSAMHFWRTLHGTGATVSRQLKPSALLRLFRDYEDMFPHPDGVYSTWTFCRVELSGAS